MRKLILVVHISLDGFVAGTQGELDGFPSGEENLQFVCGLTESADAALFGRKSYELLEKYWPVAKDLPGASTHTVAYSNWYNKATKIVLSKTIRETRNNTIFISHNIAEAIKKLKQQPGKDILIFGSPSVAQICMQLDLIDSYWIFINPVIFGEGISLFNNSTGKIKLKLANIQQFANGEAALHYLT